MGDDLLAVDLGGNFSSAIQVGTGNVMSCALSASGHEGSKALSMSRGKAEVKKVTLRIKFVFLGRSLILKLKSLVFNMCLSLFFRAQ